MVKHTQTSRQFADELFECARPSCELALKGSRGHRNVASGENVFGRREDQISEFAVN